MGRLMTTDGPKPTDIGAAETGVMTDGGRSVDARESNSGTSDGAVDDPDAADPDAVGSSSDSRTAEPVIEAQGLHHRYPDSTVGLDGIDLTLRAGERVAIVGPNGSGKSTLQLALGGLIEPAGGHVRYFGETTDAESVRRRLGVLLQDPDDYLFNTTVREDLEYGPAQLGVEQSAAADRIDRLAAELGLEELLDRPPFRLSGGEKQRAALASVLAFDPEVLLLDEPISAIDGAGRERILDLLDAQHERGKTLVIFTPDLELVPRIADRVIVLAPDGTVAADGDVREVLTDAALLAANDLRPPAAVRLFEDIDGEVPLTIEEGRKRLLDRAE
jgi:cobalt/nickel transport system ATP-binding protein